MNFLFGLVLGVLATVGAAWVHDSSVRGPDQGAQAREIVNWSNLDASVRGARQDIANGWSRLTGEKRERE